MSDAIVRLLLKTNDFDSNLKKSKNEISSFSNFMSGAGGVVAKFAGGLGLAMTAGEAFNKVLQSSQTLGDMTASNMAALKTSVDEFFYSLGTGEFSSFLSGMDDVISKAKEAYAALDQLGNTQISYGVFSAKYQSEIADAQYMAKNKFAPDDQRRANFDTWRTRLKEQQAAITRLQEELINSASKDVEAKTNANITVSMEDMLKAFEADLLDPAKRAEVKSRAKYGTSNYQTNAKRKDWSKEQKDALAESQKQNLIIHTMLEKYNDDELKGIAAKIQQYYQLNSALKSVAREYNESATEYNNSMAKMKGFKPVDSLEGFKVFTGNNIEVKLPVKPVIPAGSLAELDTQIASLKKKLNLAISNEDRVRINAELNALTEQKRVIEFQYKYPNAPTGKLDGKSSSLADMVRPEMPTRLPDFPDFSDKIDKNKQYAESLSYIGDAFNSIGSITRDSDAAVIQYFANLMSSISSAIPMIASMVAAKKAEANANAEAAATGAASSVSSIPFVGPAMAVAAIASVLAALAAIPKFADGGIIGGSSFLGDKMIARVNSGEMILNQSQQGRLFQMINSGNSGGNVKVDGEIKVRGKAMYIAIRNYMKSENIKW